MEQTYNTRAIILNRQDYREDDSRIVVYSERYGKLNLVARGAKKMKSKSSGHIEPLTLSRLMVIKGKEFDYVGTAKGEEFYSNIKEDLLSLSWAGRSLFAVDVFSREQDADGAGEVFSLLVDFLSSLPQIEPGRRESFYWLFIWKLLVVSGFGLDLAPEAASDRVGLFLSSNLERPLKEVDFGLLDDFSAQRLIGLVESAWKTYF